MEKSPDFVVTTEEVLDNYAHSLIPRFEAVFDDEAKTAFAQEQLSLLPQLPSEEATASVLSLLKSGLVSLETLGPLFSSPNFKIETLVKIAKNTRILSKLVEDPIDQEIVTNLQELCSQIIQSRFKKK